MARRGELITKALPEVETSKECEDHARSEELKWIHHVLDVGCAHRRVVPALIRISIFGNMLSQHLRGIEDNHFAQLLNTGNSVIRNGIIEAYNQSRSDVLWLMKSLEIPFPSLLCKFVISSSARLPEGLATSSVNVEDLVLFKRQYSQLARKEMLSLLLQVEHSYYQVLYILAKLRVLCEGGRNSKTVCSKRKALRTVIIRVLKGCPSWAPPSMDKVREKIAVKREHDELMELMRKGQNGFGC
jgi:hypothetical protein